MTEPDDIIDKMAYAHANPCAADLVDHASQWPGVSSIDAIVRGRSLTALRPAHFFRADGPMPKSVSLAFARPPGFDHLTREAFVALVNSTCAWAHIEALMRKRDFLREYAASRADFLAGVAGVLFPPGTWAMRRFVTVAPVVGFGMAPLDPAPS